jgi:transport and Golgi organization protein 2
MCTLILGVEVLGPNTILLGANRDESPRRPAAGPGVLSETPRVVGGKDLLAGGTWLAVREARFVAALLNRRPAAGPGGAGADAAGGAGSGTPRSRGLLCLETAAAEAARTPLQDRSFLDAALASVERNAYAPCTLVGVGTDGEAWCVGPGEGGGAPRVEPIPRGWHVITHSDLDDPAEPRTKALLDSLGDRVPPSVDTAVEQIANLLRGHGEGGARAVCLHEDPFPTVSSSILALGYVGRPRYLHAPGPPCMTPYEDFSALLGAAR